MAKKNILIDEETDTDKEKFRKYWADFGTNFRYSNLEQNGWAGKSKDSERERSIFQLKLYDYSRESYVIDSLPFHPLYRYNRHKK